MMIFRILCGEWIEPLWDCMRAEGKVVSFFFIFSGEKKTQLFSNADILLSKLDFFFNSQSSIKSREKYVRTIAEHPKFQSVT